MQDTPLKDLILQLADYDNQYATVVVPADERGEWEIAEYPHQGNPRQYTLHGTAEEVLLEMIDSEQARTSNAEVGPWSADEVEAIQRRCDA